MLSTVFTRWPRWTMFIPGLSLLLATLYGASAADRAAGIALAQVKAMAAKPAGRLTVAIPADFANLTPYTAGHSTADFVMELVFDKLYAPSPYVSQPEPWLAESAQPSGDNRSWVVRLRPGIAWHDGRPFTAEDVKFTYDYYRAGPVNRWTHHVSRTPRIEAITIEDPLTLRFVCADPCPWLDRVTLADLVILPKHIWQGVREPNKFTGSLPIGTGPYRLVERVPDQFYRFQANGQYFKGRPVVQELVMVVVKDYSAAFAALKSGEVDAVSRPLGPELVEGFKHLPGLKVVKTVGYSNAELVFNKERYPFTLSAFRRALVRAVDHQALVNTILLGHGIPGNGGYAHPKSVWTKPGLGAPHDPAAARAILDGLRFVDRDADGVRKTPDGQRLEFEFIVPSTEPLEIRATELVAGHLAKIGVKLNVRALDPSAINKLWSGGGTHGSFLWRATPHALADPDQLIDSHYSGYLGGAGGKNPPELASLIDQWRKVATFEARQQAAFKIQEYMLENPPVLVYYYPDEFYAFRPAAYDGWAESPGYGIVHKWSLLPPGARGTTVSAPAEVK